MLDNSAFVPGRFSGQQRQTEGVLDQVQSACTATWCMIDVLSACLHGSDLATEFSALFSRPVMLKTALQFSAHDDRAREKLELFYRRTCVPAPNDRQTHALRHVHLPETNSRSAER